MLTPEDIRKEEERRERIMEEYLYSPEYQDKLKERIKIQDAGNRSPEARKNIFYLCQQPDDPAAGCIFFIENFGWTFNPKIKKMKHFPFILFEFQKRAIMDIVEHIDNGRDLFTEKSREMGASWLFFCYISLWYWLFREGSNILLGSYKEKLVDDRGVDSLFGKLDYAISNLPDWMMPSKFVLKNHRTKLKLANPENGNIITGDTMNPNFGRGSRKTVIMFDELAFWDYAKDAWESAGDSTNCRIANSTPNGEDYFKDLRDSGIDILSLHWREHPLKDQQWYAYECKRRTEEEIAQEIDISYTKSKEGRVYPEWNENNVLIGKYEYNDELPLYIGWDFGKCLTGDTEALTPKGWKKHNELEEGDLIYTLNPETGVGEWQKMKGKLVLQTDEIISVAEGKGFKSRFTNGHSFPVKRNGVYELDIFDNINSYESIPSGAELFTLPKNKKYSDSFVELVAWFWTEGYINNGGVEISQAKPENFDRIRNCLYGVYGDKFIERKPKLRKNTNLPLIRWYVYKKYSKKLLDICDNNKVISYEFLNNLTKEQLELFIETSLLADGYNGILKQSVKERTERFAYAALLLGKKISYSDELMGIYGKYRRVDIFTTPPKVVPYNFKRRGKVKKKKYKGVVWCPTVENHIWLARSNGTVYFTGNTDDTAIIWSQPTREGLRIIDVFRKTGKNIDFFIPIITGMIYGDSTYTYNEEELQMINEHRNWKKATHYGDPAGRFQNQVTDDTVWSVLRQHNIIVNFQDKWKEFTIRKHEAKMLIMGRILLNETPRTKYFHKCINQSSYPSTKVGGKVQIRSEKPKHDWTSHYRSAFEYLAIGISEGNERLKTPYDKFPKKLREKRRWGAKTTTRY